jgi:L-aspartate semialdehyde sulfurtransferase ferredoxin
MSGKATSGKSMSGAAYSKRCWFTFPTRTQVEQPIIWQMSRKFPDVSFDIRQASVQNEIGIMAVLLSGREDEVNGAIQFLRSRGVTVEPIEKSVVEG